MRDFTYLVSEGFIWAVGITRPKPGKERTAALFITLMLAGSLIAVGIVFLSLMRLF